MKQFIVFIITLTAPLSGISQIVVNNTNTVEWYVQNILLGSNVTVSNVTLNGAAGNVQHNQVGEFTDPTSSVGLANGMILATGNANSASDLNLSTGASDPGIGLTNDPDLDPIASNTLYDKCILEFDFIPTGDSINFNYVFGSEEYPEYVCSGFNDVFGFFLTGNNPSGGTYNSQNVALIPDPLVPGTYTNTAVAINTVNPGVAGSNGTAATCSALDPSWSTYSVFYQANTTNTYEYDGRTTTLPVDVAVNCGETYHIKIAISDVGDGLFDSGVFLEAGSFSSNGTVVADPPVLSDITMCSSVFTVNFQGPSVTPEYSIWYFGNGDSASVPAPVYTYPDTGTYDVMYIAIDSSSACVAADTAFMTVTIIENETLTGTFSFPPVDPCSDSLLVSMDFTGSGADSIIWDLGNGDLFNDSLSLDYTYYVQGEYEVTMSAWDLECGGTLVLTDSVHFISNFSFASATAPPDTTLCSLPPFSMDFTSDGSSPDVFWDFGDGNTSILEDPSNSFADSGSYQVMFVAIDSTTCNIADTVYFNVTLNQAAQFSAEFDLPIPEPCTEPDSMLVQLSFTGSGADSLIWSMGDGTTFTNDTAVDYYYQNQGQYIVSMTAWDFVCNNIATFTDTVDFVISFSTAQAIVPPNIFLCDSPFNVDFIAGANPPPNSFWDFGDGIGSSNENDPTYTYADTGLYTVMYVAIDSTTCNIADSVYFSVQLDAAEQFSAVLGFDPPPPCGSDSLFINMAFTGSGADSIVWDMGNGDLFFTDSVNYVYTEPGVYTVEMTAYDNVCNHVETISETVPFAGNPNTEVIIPNVFTPNGDNKNDVLSFVNIDDTQDFSLRIYNRWGVKVFETLDAANHWDGKNKKGEDMDDAVYYFEIVFTDICSSEARVETGFVHLMR
ncbi:choice-of-anchor L domain-containing protein [Flavobacteriales bacterium]|nr:choice-of-anchor L domain-containing protein [Flavobacteriales bacterium]